MKLSRASHYAIAALVHMVREGADKAYPANVIAVAENIPEGFLFTVLRGAVTAGLLVARKGRLGGYCLSRPAGDISLLEIIEASEGPLNGQALGDDIATDRRLQTIMHGAAEAIRKQLARVSLADLARDE